MELICYQSNNSIESYRSFDLALHLWHFSNVFEVLEFKVNGVSLSDISLETFSIKKFTEIIKENEPSHFEISIFDSNKDYILKLIDVLNFSLNDELDPLRLEFVYVK
jgi:hypothetical protein